MYFNFLVLCFNIPFYNYLDYVMLFVGLINLQHNGAYFCHKRISHYSIITNNQTHLTLNIGCCNTEADQPGGGALGYLGGRIHSLLKLKNTPKALISGQKSTLILIKR